jgi:uncharacterized protein (DUF1015 family)
MPEVSAFAGIRYSKDVELKDVVCPPYDIISPEEQSRLYDKHPHNAVRVELPFSEHPDEADQERYRRAAHHFAAWLTEGILAEDRSPSFYVYRQDYVFEGKARRVMGVIGALSLEAFGGSGVLPHEKTMPGPVEDRLALLRACPVNISPIYAIYSGGSALAPYLEALAARAPAARFMDESGTRHRMWVVEAPAEVDMLSEALGRGPLVIADGHHRYETALAYHLEHERGTGSAGPQESRGTGSAGPQESRGTGSAGPQDDKTAAVMCFCVDVDSEDVSVLPYHRAFSSSMSTEEIERRLLEFFPGKSLSSGEGMSALQRSSADHPLLFVFPEKDVLVEVADEEVERRTNHPAALRRLDVVALHEVVMPQVLPDGLEQLLFSSDAELVLSLVRSRGRTGGVMLRAVDAGEVLEVAASGLKMPQKASYFWPKALTGLVFRALSDDVLPRPQS